ncbi:hypothetical protein D3C87_1629170 [compost metagenome]
MVCVSKLGSHQADIVRPLRPVGGLGSRVHHQDLTVNELGCRQVILGTPELSTRGLHGGIGSDLLGGRRNRLIAPGVEERVSVLRRRGFKIFVFIVFGKTVLGVGCFRLV